MIYIRFTCLTLSTTGLGKREEKPMCRYGGGPRLLGPRRFMGQKQLSHRCRYIPTFTRTEEKE